MRIGIDGTRIMVPDGGGRYTFNLIKYLIEDNRNEYVLILPKIIDEFEKENVNQVITPSCEGLKERFRFFISLHSILKKERVDVFHCTTNYGIINSPCPVVVTVHDLITIKHPLLRSTKVEYYIYKYILSSLLKRAAAIITVSESTKKDLIKYFKLSNGLINIIYNGYNQSTFHAEYEENSDLDILNKYKVKPGYILFVGYITPKKNLDTLLSALALLKKQGKLNCKLVIVGSKGYRYSLIKNKIIELQLQENIVELGFVPDNELSAIYRNTSVFVYPSIYEGFGLPPLEAMACGCPVITSNTSSLPEVVGDAGIMVDPYDVDGLADAMHEVLTNDGLRANMIKKGLERAKRFSWEKCAKETLKVYEQIMGNC